MTKYSQNKITFGYDLNYNINPSTHSFTNSSSTSECIKYMNNTRIILQNKGNKNQSNYDYNRPKSHNKNRTPAHKYEVGDLILVDVSRRTTENKSKFTPTSHGPHEIIHIIMEDKVLKIREIENESHIQEINIKFIKPCKASPYMMVMNCVMDNPQIKSCNVVKYIQQRKLTLNLLKNLTPSSKKRQMLCFSSDCILS